LDLALAIGGDNYCYSGFTERFAILNKALIQKGIPIVLWGCSIDKERICPNMLKDLRRFNLIIARESITYNTLRQAGLSKVVVMPDAAFLLEENGTSFPKGFELGNTVGLNISPLVIRQEKVNNIVMNNCYKLIEFILDETDMHIALIPHVVWEGNDDREPLCKLYEKYHSTNRIIMVEDADAPTLKTIIHNCRFMVASRTHASIAGYSTGVPTLTIGYSVKSMGIASDLFGSAEHYVLPVSDIKDEEKLKNAFTWLIEHENNIRKHYELKLGDYLSQLKKDILDELL
jgi:polysaccharide pyruvyl transferase WcaK-like protein